jgi:hypothetical protein
MEQYLAFIDAYVLALCVILSLTFTVRMANRALLPVRKFPVFFLYFGTFLIFSAMCGHLFENSLRAILRAVEGNFIFDYTFYSRIFMGVVFISISGYMLSQIKAWLQGDRQAKINFIKAAVCITLLSAPIVLFRPIGLLPTIACLISLSALPFATKRKRALVLQQV